MARPRLPKAKALVEGRHIVHPERHKRRNEPTAASLGKPSSWLSEQQREAWHDFVAEAPWLNSTHRCLVEIASIMRARLMAGGEVGVQSMNLLRLCIGQMGLSPVDASKVSWAKEDEPDDLLD